MTPIEAAMAVNLGAAGLNVGTAALRLWLPRVYKAGATIRFGPCDGIEVSGALGTTDGGGTIKFREFGMGGSAVSPPSPAQLPRESRDEYIVAHRLWDVVRLSRDVVHLQSISNCTAWPFGSALEAPLADLDHHHGIHAYKTPLPERGVRSGRFRVYGDVALWGRVVEHADGYRAQFAYPLRIVCADSGTASAFRRWYGCETTVESAA